MSESSRISQQPDLPRLHVASLTHSEMIILNIPQLQALHSFAIDLVISDDQEERQIVAFPQPQEQQTYLLLVPLAFYTSTKNNCRSFVELLCLCSQTITLPITGKYYDEVTALLASYCLNYRYKKGKNFVKLYLSVPCFVTYLDFVTFQAVHFKEKNCRQLMALKKANAYQFCLAHFREDLLPAIFTSEEEDSIENILEQELAKLRQLFQDLISEERFTLVYELMKESGSTLKELEKEVEGMVLARHITTVGDQQFQNLIGQELEGIVKAELEKHRSQLKEKGDKQGQFIYVKIVYQLLRKLREHGFEINDDKYLFIISKVVQDIRAQQQDRDIDIKAANAQLTQTVLLQRQQIANLNEEIQALKQQLQAKRKRDLSIVVEEKEQSCSVKRSTSELHIHNNSAVTIKDLKEPLQLLNFNTPILKTPTKAAHPSIPNSVKCQPTLSKANQHKQKTLPVARRRVAPK